MEINKKDVQNHTFEGGIDSDTAPELMPANRARYMLNVRSYTFGQKGVITNVMGNTMVSTPLPDGENKAVGWGSDEENNQFYFFVKNSNAFHTIFMYDALKNNVVILLQSKTDSNGVDILNIDENYLINHVDIIPSINGPLLTWCDGLNNARKINRNKALDKSVTGYGLIIFQDFINAYKKSAVYAPTVSYTTDTSRNSNFLYGKLFKFTVRFLYDDGEQSNWSDWSLVALPPNQSYSGLNTITYDNNCIIVQLETGNQLVVKIQVAMKVGTDDFVITTILDKSKLLIQDNSTYAYKFYNDGADMETDQEKIIRQYSFLPARPLCQAFVKNAMTYSNFKEGWESLNIQIDVSVSYQDLFIPDGTINELNSPSFITTLISNGYESGSLGINKRWNVNEHFIIGFDVKSGNVFSLFGRNGGSANYIFNYTATADDSSITVANKFKAWLRGIGRGLVVDENIDGSGNVSWDFQILGYWNESPVSWTSSVTPVNFQVLKDNGDSVNLIKPGSTRKYALAYEDDEDGSKSPAYTCDTALIYSGFITEVGDQKRAVHTVAISSAPPLRARYYYLLRTPDSGPWIEMLIQKVIDVDPDPTLAGDNQKYLDLVVGSLFTYQKLHPNTVIVYDFTKGDRLRLIKYYNDDGTKTLYPFLETEVLSYSINTQETVNENIALDGTDVVTINGVANPSYAGKILIVNGYQRTIISAPAGNKYQLDSPVIDGTVSAVASFASFVISDQRGILRIKRPDSIDVKDLSLVEIYKPQLNDSVDGYKQFYPFGPKFEIGNYGTPQAYHTGTVQNQFQTGPSDPAIISVIQGDAYERNRELPTNNMVPGTQIMVDHVTDPNYSDFYESNISLLGRVFAQDDGSGVKDFGSRTRFSNVFIEDTRINGNNDFDNLDRVDYNDPYGDTMLTKFAEQKLLIFKYRKTAWAPVSATIITDNSDQSLVGTSSKLLGQLQYYAWQGGIGRNGESYIANGNYRYFASCNSGVFLRIAGDGCDPISSLYNYDKESRRILAIVDKLGLDIFGGVDPENNEIIWTIPAYDNYIFKGGFIESEWNTANDALPAGTTFEITQQPAHGSVSLDGDGMFVITTDNTLGDDFFLYRAKLPNGTYLPVRKECYTVVQSSNRQTSFQVREASIYCRQATIPDYPQDGMQSWKYLESIYTDDNSLTGFIMPNVAQISPQAIVPDGTTITYHQNIDVTPTGGSDGDIWYNEPSDVLYKNISGVWTVLTNRVTNVYYQYPIQNLTDCPITIYHSIEKSGTADKQGCPTHFHGSTVTYTVPAGTYTSMVSQALADAQAQADVDANKQAYANTNGTCIEDDHWFNVDKSGTAQKAGCPEHYHGSIETYDVPAGTYKSYISQSDADAMAQADVDANKQEWANDNGTCIEDDHWFNVEKSGTANKSGCTSPSTGSLETYVVAAGVYKSYVSQADADAQAQADVDANKQAYADSHGTCKVVVNYVVIEQSSPYCDANLNIKDNATVYTYNSSATGYILMDAGNTLIIDGFGQLPSDGSNPTLHTRLKQNGTIVYDETDPNQPPPTLVQESSPIITASGDVFDILVEAHADAPIDPVSCGVPTTYEGGESFPTDTVIELGSGLGKVAFHFDALSVPDKAEVWFDGVKVIDTGYRGDLSYQSALNAALASRGLPPETIIAGGVIDTSFVKGTATATCLVRIYAPLPDTSWSFKVGCPVSSGNSVVMTEEVFPIDKTVGTATCRFNIDVSPGANIDINYNIDYVQNGVLHTGAATGSTTITSPALSSPDIPITFTPEGTGGPITSVIFTYSLVTNPVGGDTVFFDSPNSVGV